MAKINLKQKIKKLVLVKYPKDKITSGNILDYKHIAEGVLIPVNCSKEINLEKGLPQLINKKYSNLNLIKRISFTGDTFGFDPHAICVIPDSRLRVIMFPIKENNILNRVLIKKSVEHIKYIYFEVLQWNLILCPILDKELMDILKKVGLYNHPNIKFIG
jgi:hypothetical protein